MVIKSYGMDKYAINPHKIKSTKEGKCLMKVFFILKWKNWADNIKKPIKIEDTKTKDGNQTPVTSKVDKAILLTPTKFLVKSLNPKLLNSITFIIENIVWRKNNKEKRIWEATIPNIPFHLKRHYVNNDNQS